MMSKNYYKEIAEMLGLELDEEFEITNNENIKLKFTKNSLKLCRKDVDLTKWANTSLMCLDKLIGGEEKIIKKPFKPRKGDIYYFISLDCEVFVDNSIWYGDTTDLIFFNVGNCFRTEEEAEEHKDEIVKKLKENYENG